MPSYLEQLDAAPADQRWRMARGWLFGEPLPFFAELRAQRPVLALPEVTLVTRFADCDLILRDYDTFGVDLYKPKQGGYWMAQDDTAQHWREKSIMRAILDREEIPAIRAWVGQKAASLLAAGRGQLDVVGGLSRAVPVALVQEWFGYKDSSAHDLVQWSYWNQIDAFWNQPFDAIVVADPGAIVVHRELSDVALAAYLAILIAARTAEIKLGGNPQDAVSRLLELSFSGALKFGVADVLSNVGGLLIGPIETTSHCAINALEVLFSRPDQLAAARAAAQAPDPTAFDGFVWEALRFKPAFPYFFRTCHRPTTLALGTPFAAEVPAGATVLAVTHSAMFDDSMFADPDRFDPARSTASAFTFGQGLHECLGRPIGAAMTPEIVRQCLLLPGLHPVSPPDYKGGPVPEAYELAWNA
ncbi:MAG TPA: cytochrome P450 [Caulobacteraceae bacterium]